MTLTLEPWQEQAARWPASGKHILAQFDEHSIVVYQAYRTSIGKFAVDNGWFGGEFSYNRMSWIKPNFLWMMYRCGWASKEGQEVVLAVRITRDGFDSILRQAVHSTFVPELYETRDAWSQAVRDSNVRLQWDPDHDPLGQKVDRRAIQLGLRGDALKAYGRDWIVSIEDVTSFVREQAELVRTWQLSRLMTPREDIYPATPANL